MTEQEATLTIRIPETLKENFKNATFLNGTGMTKILLSYIQEYVELNKEKLEKFENLK